MTLDATVVIPAIIAGAYSILGLFGWALCAVSARADRALERRPLFEHVCSMCSRKQFFIQQFDPSALCRACEISVGLKPREIDLDDFADADAMKAYLEGIDFVSERDVPVSAGPGTD